jgi:hypothetical protein
MIEVVVGDTCGSPVGKAPSGRFCLERNQFCYESPTVEYLSGGTVLVPVCLFETTDQILDEFGGSLVGEERRKFEKIWADDDFLRTFKLQEHCLLIRADAPL